MQESAEARGCIKWYMVPEYSQENENDSVPAIWELDDRSIGMEFGVTKVVSSTRPFEGARAEAMSETP